MSTVWDNIGPQSLGLLMQAVLRARALLATDSKASIDVQAEVLKSVPGLVRTVVDLKDEVPEDPEGP